jgi:hypothetical protein
VGLSDDATGGMPNWKLAARDARRNGRSLLRRAERLERDIARRHSLEDITDAEDITTLI